jgi:hypothetical protein
LTETDLSKILKKLGEFWPNKPLISTCPVARMPEITSAMMLARVGARAESESARTSAS